MKPASPTLLALLATRQFYRADLYEFTLVGGTVLRYCTGDMDVNWNSQVWSAGKSIGPYLDTAENKATFHWKVGVEVDTLTFDVLPGSANINGVPFLSAIRQGMFDGADLTIYRAYMPTYNDTAAGTVIVFTGRVSEVNATRSVAKFNVSSHLELLNLKMPHNLYQSGCVNTLYDGTCGLIKSSFGVSATVSAVTSTSRFNAVLGQATDYFTQGTITFTSGANAGVSRTVKSWGANTFVMIAPFPNLPVIGDAFTAYPGCDKTQSTCQGKFNNFARFRGFPFIPENSTAV